MGGGIARMMGEVARRYPASLQVSTGSHPDSQDCDATIPVPIHRVAVPSRRLRTVQGLIAWTRAAAALAGSAGPGFIWCGNFKPAAYPARWIHRRQGTPYGVFLHGTELLLLQDRLPGSALKRRIARELLGPASVLAANSRWTRDLCLEVAGRLGLKRDESNVRVIPLGTDPDVFRPGLDTSAVRWRYGLSDGRWLLTVARLAAHKGIDTGLRVLGALRLEFPDLRYAIVGSGIGQAQLEALAGELELAHRVRFLTHVPDVDLPALYNAAEIYLGLSRTVELMAEGFGISLSEASACRHSCGSRGERGDSGRGIRRRNRAAGGSRPTRARDRGGAIAAPRSRVGTAARQRRAAGGRAVLQLGSSLGRALSDRRRVCGWQLDSPHVPPSPPRL